jgi:hypothetical protein
MHRLRVPLDRLVDPGTGRVLHFELNRASRRNGRAPRGTSRCEKTPCSDDARAQKGPKIFKRRDSHAPGILPPTPQLGKRLKRLAMQRRIETTLTRSAPPTRVV